MPLPNLNYFRKSKTYVYFNFVCIYMCLHKKYSIQKFTFSKNNAIMEYSLYELCILKIKQYILLSNIPLPIIKIQSLIPIYSIESHMLISYKCIE